MNSSLVFFLLLDTGTIVIAGGPVSCRSPAEVGTDMSQNLTPNGPKKRCLVDLGSPRNPFSPRGIASATTGGSAVFCPKRLPGPAVFCYVSAPWRRASWHRHGMMKKVAHYQKGAKGLKEEVMQPRWPRTGAIGR
ncbi:hypothetical protein V8F20_012601 [Naviculisporaceae sp. PSN 640]